MAFLKFLFIAFLVLYILRLIFRLVFPMVLKNMFSKVQQQAENQARQRNSRPDGAISIDYMPPQPKGGRTDKLGDFVDYEEVK
ncbi:hypothetical protein SAMN05421820_10596 [Pedobacter steynii]|uniref:DUF4834 domain-containing protein n=1 Tax=Pedobacter steynii TaxID=430522 RepID=A0A1G9W8H7_9SPHI|nr:MULTISPECIES: DUF4834 family protein [Pedobacter]NQX40213.1 DUF4834 family protein [Pedobacter steynii]RQO67637.1 DUF4834 domain-containing protein [Pedobacter sp. KBW06]SDM80812.1 hypothetical protein SAMN05421820_10596 [Pedobacter steynii]